MGKNVIKELFIISLLIVVIMFTIGILLYDYVPTNQSLPETIEYLPDSSVTSILQEIEISKDETNEDIGLDNSNESSSLLKSYSIDKSDLKNYESKNAFASGKADPFSDYQVAPDGNAVTNQTGSSTGSANNNTVSGNNTSSSTGTFFENPSSK